jgi:hypothetical protein
MSDITKYLSGIGKKGGDARAASLTAEQRSSIAKRAAKARWKKARKKK